MSRLNDLLRQLRTKDEALAAGLERRWLPWPIGGRSPT